jgi:hypothetical protein
MHSPGTQPAHADGLYSIDTETAHCWQFELISLPFCHPSQQPAVSLQRCPDTIQYTTAIIVPNSIVPDPFPGHHAIMRDNFCTGAYVVKAGPDFAIVARNDLDEFCIASPAIVGDKLLIRTASKLVRLSEGAKLDAATAARLQPRKNASSATDIWSAAAAGDRDQILRLLTSGVSVNARQSGSGSTPLNTAAVFGQTAVAKLLIEKGADVTTTNTDGNTALHIASFLAHTDFVKLLLEKGASINVKNRRGETPLDTVSANWSPRWKGPAYPSAI